MHVRKGQGIAGPKSVSTEHVAVRGERQLGESPKSERAHPGLSCPVCARPKPQVFIEIPEIPTLSNVLLKTAEAARRWPKAPIRLGFCNGCGWIGNTAFDSHLLNYDERYENSLHYSAVFQKYAERLALSLWRRFRLKDKFLIEIGCGQGAFLRSLCELGGNRGVGFDPGFAPERARSNGSRNVRFVRDYYSPQYANLRCDFLCCRHVLEHIENPKVFLQDIRQTLGQYRQVKLYFEVPNALHMLRGRGIWDPIYEHHSYFSRYALRHLFVTSGFRVLEMREGFGQQFLCLHAGTRLGGMESKGPSGQHTHLQRLADDTRNFSIAYRKKIEETRAFLRESKRLGKKVALWGAGSKGVNFLNVFRREEAVEFGVDLNPFKQGKYIPGTGQKIVAPEFLPKYRPDVVVVMNPIYRMEIAAKLAGLGLATEMYLV